MARSLIDRFNDRHIPEPNSGCWLWTAACSAAGYGQIGHQKRVLYAHRLSFEIASGEPLPAGAHVLHKCDVPSCVNPSHLFLGTHLDNMLDAMNKGRMGPKIPARGEQVGRAKLTDDAVRHIRAGDESSAALAARYSVDLSLIYQVRQRKIWRHVQ